MVEVEITVHSLNNYIAEESKGPVIISTNYSRKHVGPLISLNES